MRQVPENIHYTLIGSGRVARHFAHYLSLLNIPYSRWSRSINTPKDLENSLSSHILLLISDKAIGSFFQRHKSYFKNKTVVHFSGSLNFPDIKAAHPLTSFFQSQLYSLETYQKVPFILEKGESFQKVLPKLPNPYTFLDPSQKSLYHSYCVLAGNFTSLIWQAVSERFEKRLSLNPKILEPYKEQIFKNLKRGAKNGLTGPLSRQDHVTIESHLQALKSDDLLGIYEAFLKFYQKQRGSC